MKKFLILILLLIAPTVNAGDDIEGEEYSEGYIARSNFTTEISEREPVDEITSFNTDAELTFFTEIMDMEGKTVTHRWIQEDEELFSMDFYVGGPRWRVWTTKNIYDWNVGSVKVVVEDQDGNVLAEQSIVIPE